MAIQIDLLPQYVGLRRKVKWAAIIMTLIYAIAGTAFTLVWHSKTLEVKTAQANKAAYEAPAAEATKVKGDAEAKVTSLKTIEDTVTFFTAATQTGPRRAVVIDMMKMYIAEDSLVSSIDIPDGKNVRIEASIKNTDDYGKLLLNMRKGTVGQTPAPATPIIWGSLPKGSGIKGYPAPLMSPPRLVPFGEFVPVQFPLNVALATTLKDDLVFDTPVAPGEAVAAAAAGQPGSGGATSSPTAAP
ncbi:MAG TPA: hypothetical protein VGB77_10200 [Abditibacteriaceae bacterium]|jgi:hypothetical protein